MGDPSQISKRFRKKSHKADETMHKSQPADVILVSLVEQKFLENRKKSYSRENLTLKLYIDRTFVKVWGKIDNAIPEKKRCIRTSKSYIRTLKTFYPNLCTCWMLCMFNESCCKLKTVYKKLQNFSLRRSCNRKSHYHSLFFLRKSQLKNDVFPRRPATFCGEFIFNFLKVALKASQISQKS